MQPHHYRPLLGGEGRGWVAELDGGIAGFAVADLARGNVWALFVDPDFEGRGVGRRLHDAMMEWCFASGAERVWLSTDPGTRAEAFYRAALEMRRTELRSAAPGLWWVDAPAGVLVLDRGARLRCVVNLSDAPHQLQGEVLLASGPVSGDALPPDTAAWLRVP